MVSRSRPSSQPRGRAFTLIELLVVIAVVALLIGLLVPALGESRRAAQGAVSLTNLRQLAMTQVAYAAENKDSLFNPFDPARAVEVSGDTWALAFPLVWWFGSEEYASLMFSPHWAGLMLRYLEAGGLAVPSQFSPADRAMMMRFREGEPKRASGGWGEGAFQSTGWDGSYWMSPTLWTTPAIWQGNDPPRLSPKLEAGPSLWRLNRMDQVVAPQAKVSIWERFDTSKSSRLSGSKREPLPPNWNNPEATARAATIDGSVTSVRIASLQQVIARDEAAGGTGQTWSDLRPCGDWAVPDELLATYGMQGDSLENGGRDNPGRYPAYFWATRDGVRGRDLNR